MNDQERAKRTAQEEHEYRQAQVDRMLIIADGRDPDPTGVDMEQDFLGLALSSLPNRTRRKPPSEEFLKYFTPPPRSE